MRLPTALTLQTAAYPKTYANSVQALGGDAPDSDGNVWLAWPQRRAGKSRILATLQEPDGGSVRLGDTDETVRS